MVYLHDRIRQSDEFPSPIRTVITTSTRKSVNMVAELDNDTAPSRILDTIGQKTSGGQLYSSQGCYSDCSGVGHKGPSSTGNSCSTVVQLKSELAQSQQSRTEAKVLHAIALKPPSDFGADTAAVRMRGRLMGLQVQEQHVRPDKDQLTTDTADLKMMEEALAEDTTAFEDITQDCMFARQKSWISRCTPTRICLRNWRRL